jgi:hypothetical protein
MALVFYKNLEEPVECARNQSRRSGKSFQPHAGKLADLDVAPAFWIPLRKVNTKRERLSCVAV